MASQPTKRTSNDISFAGKCFSGGLAGTMATGIVQPLDLVKTRMQLNAQGGGPRLHKTSLHALWNISRAEGPLALYKGLSAGILRQITYGSSRLGAYTWLLQYSTERNKGKPIPFWEKVLDATTAGIFGAVIGTPAEVALVRMTADGRLPPEQRRGYTNALQALFRMAKEEGVATLWKGCVPTVLRAAVLNATQLAVYSQAKEVLVQKFPTSFDTKGSLTHVVASFISGFCCTVISLPVDQVKTRLQTMKGSEYGATVY
eukprot:TRINITY_DN1597_c0_g1_i1.p1 TRINITY_DN1597_c0_g1~~TRINITY_DN1597_c0_g1_i1.p1  ORF type:complete len:259 (-),score=57.29 TRINITY_DN1597_c0_g1_i1:88-864(-)